MKFFKRRWLVLCCFLLAGFLIVLALPTMLGSKWIYDPLIQSFAKDKLNLDIAEVQLRWFSPLELKGISVSEPNDPSRGRSIKPLLTISSIKTDRGLLSYMLSGRKLGRVEIVEPKVDIALLDDSTNLERVVDSIRRTGEVSKPNAQQEKPKLDIDIVVLRASVEVNEDNGTAPLVVVPPFDLSVQYRAVDQEPTLTIAPAKVLDQVIITPELVRLGLGHAVPLLAKSAWFDGRVSLESSEIIVPLEHPIDSKGKSRIVLHEVRAGPTEPLIVEAIELISRLRNKPASLELVFVNGTQIDVGMENQRIAHSGLEAGLPKVDERLQFSSSGSVGIVDRSLDLVMLVPVPVEQIARRESVQELGVPKLRVPVGGTLDAPVVDWNLMRKDSGLLLAMMAGQLDGEAPITSAVLNTLGGVAEGQADDAIAAAADLIRSIREKRQKAKQDSATNPPDSKQSPEEEPVNRRPLLDSLRKALRK
jgi:hypothetical protein